MDVAVYVYCACGRGSENSIKAFTSLVSYLNVTIPMVGAIGTGAVTYRSAPWKVSSRSANAESEIAATYAGAPFDSCINPEKLE